MKTPLLRKVRVLAAALAFLLPFALLAGDTRDDIFLTGHEYLIFDETERAMYIIGLKDGLNYASLIRNESYDQYVAFSSTYTIPKGISVQDIRKGIDLIYADPPNGNVRVIDALLAFKMRVDGKAQADIDKYLERSRKLAHDRIERKPK